MLELKISIGARAKIKEKLDSMLTVNSFNTTSTSQSSQSQSSLLNEFSNLNLDDNCHNTEDVTEDEDDYDEDDFDAVELEDEVGIDDDLKLVNYEYIIQNGRRTLYYANYLWYRHRKNKGF